MGAGWPYITFQVFQLVKMKLFLLKLSLSSHSCLFNCSIVFVLRAVHLIILEDMNAKKCKILVAFFLEDFVKLTLIAKASVYPVTSVNSRDVLQKRKFYWERQEGLLKPTVDSVWLSNVISTCILCF